MPTIYGYKRTDTPSKGEWSRQPLGSQPVNNHSHRVCQFSWGEDLEIKTREEAIQKTLNRLAEEGVTDVSEVFDGVP
jgi:hypothetical protein